MIPQKKLISKTKHFQEPTTSEKCIINPKKAALAFKFMETLGMSGSQDQKERKTASTVTTTFSDKKSPQPKSASATIANRVEFRKGKKMNISRFLN